MGGGTVFTGGSTHFAAARPPFSAAAGPSSSFHSANSLFGSVPSRPEVEKAILDLQRFMRALSGSNSGLNGLHELLPHHEFKKQEIPGFDILLNAFSMMQNEPALQDMVVSISCDGAVWAAILSNKAVQDLRGSISKAQDEKLLSYDKKPDIGILISNWIMGFTKSKILELVENFLLLINEIFQPTPKEKPTSELNKLLEEKIRSSVLLSVVILLIVIVTRSQEG